MEFNTLLANFFFGSIFGTICLVLVFFILFILLLSLGDGINPICTIKKFFYGNNKIEKEIYEDKMKKSKNFLSNARQFLRPYADTLNEATLANQYCIVRFIFKSNKVIFFDKIKGFVAGEEFSYYLERFFECMCNDFKYSTTYHDATKLLHFFNSCSYKGRGYTIKHISAREISYESYQVFNPNNASAAELIALPGMNAAKANKLIKEIQKNKKYFDTIDEFIDFAKLNNEDRYKIKHIFKHSTTCNIKKLPFYKDKIHW